jgi:hypothetical protein
MEILFCVIGLSFTHGMDVIHAWAGRFAFETRISAYSKRGIGASEWGGKYA